MPPTRGPLSVTMAQLRMRLRTILAAYGLGGLHYPDADEDVLIAHLTIPISVTGKELRSNDQIQLEELVRAKLKAALCSYVADAHMSPTIFKGEANEDTDPKG